MSKRRIAQLLAAAFAGAALMVAPRVAEAQTGTISGVVTDAGTSRPVEGVTVLVQGTGYGAVSQANGRYFIISVPPGNYTVVARRIGYQNVAVSNVRVTIDQTRELNFSLNSSAATLTTQRIVAEAEPLVERGVTSSGQAISAEEIQSLPVTSIAGVLALQPGFFETPANTDLVSFADSRRNPISPLRIRGGRAGSTQTLIDGIPINNVILGGQAFDLTPFAAQSIQTYQGGFEPQYGNALSGIVTVATIDGGTSLAGAIDYQTSALAGRLGSRPDELKGEDRYSGYLSGPVPGTANKLRFAVAGQLESGAAGVYEFDNETYDYDNQPTDLNPPINLDLFQGWRAAGFNENRQLFGKLTFLPTGSTRFAFTAANAELTRQPFDYDFLLTGFDPLSAPTVNSLADTLGLGFGNRTYRDVQQASIRSQQTYYGASFTQRFTRTNLEVRAGRFEQNRSTCAFFQGICTGDRFSDTNFNGQFVAPGVTNGNPSEGNDVIFGGSKVVSNIIRADLQSQVTDHHNLQGGVFFQRHDIDFAERRNIGTNDVFAVSQVYRAKPYEAAAYLQDRIEYDFLTVRLGFRYDYGVAKGRGFVNPLNPSNGTTAREVCNGQLASLGGPAQAYSRTIRTGAGDSTFTGVGACSRFRGLLDSAATIAQADDFRDADPRVAFSPRLGVSFPLSETSQIFFNASRNVQNPLYNNLYQNSGVGTTAGAGDDVCDEDAVKPGTTECVPTLASDSYSVPFIGNPNLLLEQATQYEIAYAANIGRSYAARFTVYSRDETGLTGIRRSRASQDIGTTYAGASAPNYLVIVNQDYLTSRGFVLSFTRRLTDYWGYDINYTYSKATTNAQSPDRQQEQIQEGDTTALREIRSEIDQPHVFRGVLRFGVQERAPDVRFGRLLTNTALNLTFSYASGTPYTPVQNFTGFGTTGVGDLNSGTGPSTYFVNLLASKDFRIANTRYGAFVRVTNLTDKKNCVQVFPTTGRCDQGSVDQRRARNGNSVSENTNSTFFDRPTFFGARRQIFSGLRVNF